jgi:ribonuclease BN (tRNA processing enzyme)
MKKIYVCTAKFLLLSYLAFAGQAQADSCQSERVKLQMLGTRGPELLDAHASTGYLIWLDDKARIIIDTGPGTVQNFTKSGAKYEDVLLMLFTHFHVDHSADFSAYIKGGFFSKRTNTLNVIGPSGTSFVTSASEFVTRSIGKNSVYPYLSNFIDKEANSAYKIEMQTIPWSFKDSTIKEVFKQDDFVVKTIGVHHGAFPAQGYRVEVAGCVISFSGDMSGRLDNFPKLAEGSDILVAHNAIPEDATGVPALLHMKPTYIGQLASRAKVKRLLLTHLMQRTINRKGETLSLIRKSYPGPADFPEDLDMFNP